MGAAENLARRTLELVDIPSESLREEAILAYVDDAMPTEAAYAADGCRCYRLAGAGPHPEVVCLAGHVDTVPAQANLPGRLEGGRVRGLGASDMKGGVAVMIELAGRLADDDPPDIEVVFLVFGREEIALSESPLPAFFATAPFRADLAVVLEPTDNEIHAGCVGNLNARWRFEGESAHSARPWHGRNAIDAAVRALARVTGFERRAVEVDGLTFYEVLTVTGISGGIATNVVPAEAEALLNFRYAPTRSPAEAEATLRELVGDEGTLVVESNSPAGAVDLEAPLVERLRSAGGFAVAPKQAWTPVAQFTELGVNAVNLGPGATRYAHRQDEQVEVAELVRTFEALQRFLGGTV